jgi:uncharacterized membrane protein YfcA
MDLAYTFAGFLVGFIVGLTGVGGGSLMTPILVLVFSVKPVIAVGTDLLYAAFTKGGGVWIHHVNKTVNWRIVALMSTGSLPSALAMILVLRELNAHGIDYEHLVTGTLGIALILTSLVLITKNKLLVIAKAEQLDAVRAMHRRLRTPMTIAAGAIIGALVTLSSVGAGALGAAILFFLYPRMRAIGIVGTDLAHAVPLTLVAGLGHLQLGSVNLVLLGSLLIGSLPGIYLGSHLGIKLPERVLRPILASLLLMIGLRFALP